MAFDYMSAETALQKYNTVTATLQDSRDIDSGTFQIAIASLAQLVQYLDIDLNEYVSDCTGNQFVTELYNAIDTGDIAEITDDIDFDLLNHYTSLLDVEFRKSYNTGPATVDLVSAIWYNIAVLAVLGDSYSIDTIWFIENESFTRL